MNDKITVYLSDDEAKLFVDFQKHRGLIRLLQNIGFFGLSSAKVEIFINKEAQIGDILVQKKYTSHTHIKI